MEKVSFTIRRPTPVSRASSTDSDFKLPALPKHLTDSTPGSPLAAEEVDSSDEDEKQQDELVTGFDQFGVQRLHKKPKPQGPLVIPAQENKDWRALARKRRGQAQYVPDSARATTGKDGSVGGLGTRDIINNGPVLVGLHVPTKLKQEQTEDDLRSSQERELEPSATAKPRIEESEDDIALRALLASAENPQQEDGPVVDIIAPISETEAFLQDVVELPDLPTLDDYARVPVSQFGAALLRGMGWKEGTAATRKKGKGLIQPYLPESRPALLGIGAKERVLDDDGSNKRPGSNRPERRYVPVVKVPSSTSSSTERRVEQGSSQQSSSRRDRERSRSPRRHRESSGRRQRSRSRSPVPRNYDKDRRDKDRDYDRESGRYREKRRDRSSERHSSSKRRD